jgi:hypothetical protein
MLRLEGEHGEVTSGEARSVEAGMELGFYVCCVLQVCDWLRQIMFLGGGGR